MRVMSLCPRLSQAKTQVTGKGPELGLCLEMKGSCECPADLRLVRCTNYRGRVPLGRVYSALRMFTGRCKKVHGGLMNGELELLIFFVFLQP